MPKKPLHRAPAAAAVVVGAVLLAGCSSDARTADPAEVQAAATRNAETKDNPIGVPLSREQAECRAEVILESELSDEALATFKATGQLEPATEEDAEALRIVADSIATDCM